jgi:hypothetical protein
MMSWISTWMSPTMTKIPAMFTRKPALTICGIVSRAAPKTVTAAARPGDRATPRFYFSGLPTAMER